MLDRTTLTLLAVLSLAVSNLFVGLVTKNTYLVLASSAISAVLAVLYLVRSPAQRSAKPGRGADRHLSASQALARRRVFPLWVFAAILFIILPILLVFLQTGIRST